MPRTIVAAAASVALLIAFTGGPSPIYANPAAMWVLNLNVVNASSAAAGCTAPHNCDLTTTADRAALLSSFGALQTQSGGKAEQEPSGFVGTPALGFTYILFQFDGSSTSVTMNGRGLACTPPCDAVTTSSPNPTDRFVAYKITDTGSHNIGDSLVATAIQDAVSLDSRTITVVGPPPAPVGGIAEQPDMGATVAGHHRLSYSTGEAALAAVAAFGATGWYFSWRRPP